MRTNQPGRAAADPAVHRVEIRGIVGVGPARGFPRHFQLWRHGRRIVRSEWIRPSGSEAEDRTGGAAPSVGRFDPWGAAAGATASPAPQAQRVTARYNGIVAARQQRSVMRHENPCGTGTADCNRQQMVRSAAAVVARMHGLDLERGTPTIGGPASRWASEFLAAAEDGIAGFVLRRS
jgi:hypothetical protein